MQKFLFLTHDNHDAYFNLASEEYLLKQKGGYYIYLWINAPAVIVGINQNTLQEVNLAYTEEKGIKVVRRLTGGGSVYHDEGNICYTVIAPFNETENPYIRFTTPVIEYLNSLGVKAEFSGRNDITIDGKKISGNAQTVYNDRIMHHGTILFNTDVDNVTNSLKPNKLKMQSKGIKSIRARITNVYDHLPVKITVDDFFDGLKKALSKGLERVEFSPTDLKQIDRLVKEKYSKFEWNMGRSPKGENTFSQKYDFGVFTFNFSLVNGKIDNPVIMGDFFTSLPIEDFAKTLVGVDFNKNALAPPFSRLCDFIKGANGKEILEYLFS